MSDNSIIDSFFNQLQPRLSEQSEQSLRTTLAVQHFPKRHVLVREGQHLPYAFLLMEGAARSYYLKNGVEVNTWFALENEVVGSLRNFLDAPSRETIELLEDSTLLTFDLNRIKSLMAENMEIAKLVNGAIAQHAIELEDRLFDTHLRSAQERFETLLSEQPEIFLRVPLTYIASYLGISRETLSRLRAK